MSSHCWTVEKHQSRVHPTLVQPQDGARRAKNRYQIDRVNIQSLMPQPHYRAFIVADTNDLNHQRAHALHGVPQNQLDQFSLD
jgi:hypothetical protein